MTTNSTTGNANLKKARAAKNDEFYTQREDIAEELQHYHHLLGGKVVYCNCDNPAHSNFYKYFKDNFETIGLRGLIATYYAEDAETSEVMLFDGSAETTKTVPGDGSFDSEANKTLLTRVDAVISNPPFSRWRLYFDTLINAGVDFLILGNLNAITYKNVFPHIKADRVFLGVAKRTSFKFQVPPDYPRVQETDEQGRCYTRLSNILWFTNMDHGKRHLRRLEHLDDDQEGE